MKHYLPFLFIGPLLLMIFITQGTAQTNWIKYEGNPVLNEGLAGSWDDFGVSWPFVIYNDAQFVMWYAGKPDIGYGNSQIGRATSPDGINWTKDEGNPVLRLGPVGEWDDSRIDPGPVIFDVSGFRMWYTGYDGSIWRIGLATSLDGIDWTKHEGNPVLNEGPGGSWDDEGVAVSTVLFKESIYKMWYVGADGANFEVGYATSSDGIDWTEYEENPVLDVGSSGSWDANNIEHAYVILNGNIYKMWYHGRDASDFIRTGYAISSDGITWTKHEGNPVLDVGSLGGWDMTTSKVGSVILQDNVYKMWYMGRTGSIEKIGYASDSSATAIEGFSEIVPKMYILSQNYPNPFNPTTIINYELRITNYVDLSVYNLLGQKVATLVSDKQSAGRYNVEWDASGYSSGIYYYHIKSGEFQDVKKMILIK